MIVGLAQPDDAAVVRLSDEQAIVFTVDFFTPIVDDARSFGRIAAANALSDVYAMGARPLVALNVAAFPTKALPMSILGEILVGGAEMAQRAGIVIAGGHTIDDPEPKYGMAVIGTVHPDRVWRKGGARAGDALVLTKALGTGIISTALKRDRVSEQDEPVRAMVASMTTLNAGAMEAALRCKTRVHAATDVTGYGLVGHLLEMLRASEGVGATLDASALCALPGAIELAGEGFLAGGSQANRESAADVLEVATGVGDAYTWLACDAQTSGGLLFAVPDEDASALVGALVGDAQLASARIIGRIEARDRASVRLR